MVNELTPTATAAESIGTENLQQGEIEEQQTKSHVSMVGEIQPGQVSSDAVSKIATQAVASEDIPKPAGVQTTTRSGGVFNFPNSIRNTAITSSSLSVQKELIEKLKIA